MSSSVLGGLLHERHGSKIDEIAAPPVEHMKKVADVAKIRGEIDKMFSAAKHSISSDLTGKYKAQIVPGEFTQDDYPDDTMESNKMFGGKLDRRDLENQILDDIRIRDPLTQEDYSSFARLLVRLSDKDTDPEKLADQYEKKFLPEKVERAYKAIPGRLGSKPYSNPLVVRRMFREFEVVDPHVGVYSAFRGIFKMGSVVEGLIKELPKLKHFTMPQLCSLIHSQLTEEAKYRHTPDDIQKHIAKSILKLKAKGINIYDFEQLFSVLEEVFKDVEKQIRTKKEARDKVIEILKTLDIEEELEGMTSDKLAQLLKQHIFKSLSPFSERLYVRQLKEDIKKEMTLLNITDQHLAQIESFHNLFLELQGRFETSGLLNWYFGAKDVKNRSTEFKAILGLTRIQLIKDVLEAAAGNRKSYPSLNQVAEVLAEVCNDYAEEYKGALEKFEKKYKRTHNVELDAVFGLPNQNAPNEFIIVEMFEDLDLINTKISDDDPCKEMRETYNEILKRMTAEVYFGFRYNALYSRGGGVVADMPRLPLSQVMLSAVQRYVGYRL
ncbi:MAG: hypothetical protein ABH829_00495 [archaeon]